MAKSRNNRPNTNSELFPLGGKYSMKNIPIPGKTEYMEKLIAQTEKIVKRMRWKAQFFLKEDDKYKSTVDEIEFFEKEDAYGFRSTCKPPPIKEMEQFEKDVYEIPRNTVFRNTVNYGKFQDELRKDIAKIQEEESIIVAADKTSNFYTCSVDTFNKIRYKNVEVE